MHGILPFSRTAFTGVRPSACPTPWRQELFYVLLVVADSWVKSSEQQFDFQILRTEHHWVCLLKATPLTAMGISSVMNILLTAMGSPLSRSSHLLGPWQSLFWLQTFYKTLRMTQSWEYTVAFNDFPPVPFIITRRCLSYEEGTLTCLC